MAKADLLLTVPVCFPKKIHIFLDMQNVSNSRKILLDRAEMFCLDIRAKTFYKKIPKGFRFNIKRWIGYIIKDVLKSKECERHR